MIDIGKQITFAKCLKMYSFFTFAFKVSKKDPNIFLVKNNNMDIKNAAFYADFIW
jgi:hypothetical protein